MPAIHYPGNDQTRLVSGQAAINSDNSDSVAGTRYLMPQTATRLAAVTMAFETKLNSNEIFLSDRMKEVREKNESLTTLDTFVRHALNSVKMRVERNGEPVEILSNYGIPSSGLLPRFGISAELTVIADKILAGDAKTVAAGFPSMVNPSPEELAAVNEVAKKEIADVAPADRAVDSAAAELAELRAEMDLLLRDVVADLNYNLRYEDEPSRRRIMRTYGVEFRSESTAE